jgi:general secretion pathway protein F
VGVTGVACVILYKIGVRAGRKRGRLAYVLGRLVLSAPFVRRLTVEANLAHAGGILARLLEAGYPVDEALDSTSASTAAWLRPVLERMARHVREGETLTRAAEREAWILPASFQGMVSLGESSGRLPDCLERAAHFYATRTLKWSKIAVSTAFPIGIVAAGCCVMTVYSSVFLVLVALVDGIIGSM